MLYFAYGSNMLKARLKSRCPGAELVAKASLTDHHVRFAKRGMDGSGKATILPMPQATTNGVLFDVPDLEIEALDAAEGVGKGYRRVPHCHVGTNEGRRVAFTYQATAPEDNILPFDWYLGLIIAGCHQHRLPETVCNWYSAHPFTDDPEKARPGRTLAVKTMAQESTLDLVYQSIKVAFTPQN